MKELRDIKLDLLMGNQNPIVDLFNKITNGLKIINTNVYNKDGLEFIYHKDGEWIFYQDFDNEEFWCNYERYWSLFETNLGLEYGDIQEVTKYCFAISQSEYLVEEALKREVSTPGLEYQLLTSPPQLTKYVKYLRLTLVVEEALKREINTPLTTLNTVFPLEVQEALLSAREWLEPLKKEIAIPDKMTAIVDGLVERSIKKIKNI